MSLRLSDLAHWSNGRLHGADGVVGSVSIDTRSLQPGALFVALPGERSDGHDFADSARIAGAAALLVARELAIDLPQVIVADTQVALGRIAHAMRLRSRARVVGITGSNGKTTVKTLLASILARHGRTHVNAGNYNNEIGLPLTLLAMPQDSEFAVLEMGAGKPGDIAYLADIARPDVALVNNVAPAHLERMGSLQGIADTKGAIYRALPDNGVAVINADDAFADTFAALAAPRRTLRYGLRQRADVSAVVVDEQRFDGRFRLRTPNGDIEIGLALPGRHNVLNALAAASAALALGVPLAEIKAGLEAAPTVAGRLLRREHASGAVVIDDSYNANPGSFAAAIDILAAEPGERVLVMGDMGELGVDAAHLHAEVGALARRRGVDRLFAVGALSRAAVAAFGDGATHCEDQEQLIARLREDLRAGVAILVKGSRSSAMERVVHALVGVAEEEGARHAA